jgi:hypothetical protein
MPTAITAHKDARAGEGFRVQIPRGSSGLDLSTVTSVSLLVRTRKGVESTWTASIESQAATLLTVAHIFAADGSETSTTQTLTVTPILYFGESQRRCESFQIQIIP